MPAVEIRSEAVLGAHEVVGIASRSGVAHLSHFLYVFHALGNNMGGDLDVEDEVAVLEFNVPDRPALHEFFPGNGVAGAHGGRGHQMWRRGIVQLIREGRVDHLILVVRVEVSLRVAGMEGPVGFCLPVVFVVVVVRMSGGGRWRIIWSDRTGRLVVKRIVLLVISHGFKGVGWLCSTEEDGGRWEGDVFACGRLRWHYV